MTPISDRPDDGEIPDDWDVLHDLEDEPTAALEGPPSAPAGPTPPPIINLVAASWADAVAALAVCTAALLGLNAVGHESLPALPWAAALGLAWWVFAAVVLVTIRQGTPGMLLAGVTFDTAISPPRIGLVVVAAAVSAALAGLPGLLGPRHSPIALAGAGRIESVPVD